MVGEHPWTSAADTHASAGFDIGRFDDRPPLPDLAALKGVQLPDLDQP
jgi:hypothetical protein